LAPLSSSTAKRMYPRLFREYASLLSGRRRSGDDDGEEEEGEEDPPPVVFDDGRDGDPGVPGATVVPLEDFPAHLGTGGDHPARADPDADRFAAFVWRCLGACGGVGGPQFGVLDAALRDAAAFASAGERFSHLLGWTIAALHHDGVLPMMSWHCPDGIRSLFSAAAAEWKEVYEAIPEGGDGALGGAGAELRGFAVRTCEMLRRSLRSRKKAMGDRFEGGPLSFNFIRKPRAKRKKAATAPAAAAVGIAPPSTPSPSSTPAPSAAAAPVTAAAATSEAVDRRDGSEGGRSDELPPRPRDLFSSPAADDDAKGTVEMTVARPAADRPLGLTVVRVGNAPKVESIDPPSPFLGTQLTAGMFLEAINGEAACATFADGGTEPPKNAVGTVAAVASFARPALAEAPAASTAAATPDDAPTDPDAAAAKRRSPPGATSDFPIAKVAKTAIVGDPPPPDVENLATFPAVEEEDVATTGDGGGPGGKLPAVMGGDTEGDDGAGDGGTPTNPHAAYFSKLEAVAHRYGPETGHILIRGISTGSDDSDGEEEDEDDEDTSKYTAEQMSTLRVVLIDKKRQGRLDEMRRFLLGDQADRGFMMFNTSYTNEVKWGFNEFKWRKYPRARTPADKFDLLFAYTYNLGQYDDWMHDNEGDMGGMVKSLAGMWKKLLKNDDERLNIDSEYSRPGVEEFLRNMKEQIEAVEMDPYPAFKFNFQ
jgi:hypothetical protein